MYLRVMKWDNPLGDEMELAILEKLLVDFAETYSCLNFKFRETEKHQKGGFRIFVNCEENLDEFLKYMSENDFRPCF